MPVGSASHVLVVHVPGGVPFLADRQTAIALPARMLNGGCACRRASAVSSRPFMVLPFSWLAPASSRTGPGAGAKHPWAAALQGRQSCSLTDWPRRRPAGPHQIAVQRWRRGGGVEAPLRRLAGQPHSGADRCVGGRALALPCVLPTRPAEHDGGAPAACTASPGRHAMSCTASSRPLPTRRACSTAEQRPPSPPSRTRGLHTCTHACARRLAPRCPQPRIAFCWTLRACCPPTSSCWRTAGWSMQPPA